MYSFVLYTGFVDCCTRPMMRCDWGPLVGNCRPGLDGWPIFSALSLANIQGNNSVRMILRIQKDYHLTRESIMGTNDAF